MIDYCVVEILGVEVIGGQPLLPGLAPLLGSIFVAGAAAYAARLAANTANDRQREQLAHDTERQKEQLAHDRTIRRQEYARNAIDDSLERIAHANDAVTDCIASALVSEEQRKQGEARLANASLGPIEHEQAQREISQAGLDVHQQIKDAHTKALEMYPAGVRLALRFSVSHPIAEKHDELMYAWDAVLKTLRGVSIKNRTEAELIATQEAIDAANRKYAEVMVEFETWFLGEGATELESARNSTA
jgi:hypothetical protein